MCGSSVGVIVREESGGLNGQSLIGEKSDDIDIGRVLLRVANQTGDLNKAV